MREAALPSARRKALIHVATLALLVIAAGLFYGAAAMKYAYLSFRDDGRAFAITYESARTVRWSLPGLPVYGPLLDKARCSTLPTGAAAFETEFSAEQTQILCEAFGTPALKKMITEDLFAQRFLTLFCAALLTWVFWRCGSWGAQATRAQALHKELSRPCSVDAPADAPATTASPAP